MATIDDLIKSIDSLTKGLETDRKERKKSEGATTPSQTPSQSPAYTQEEFNRFKRQKQDEIEATDDLNKKRSLQNEILEKQKVLLQATEKDEEKRRKGLKELNKEIEKNNDLTEESNKLLADSASFANDLASMFGALSKESSIFYNATKALSREGLPGLSKNLDETLSNANLLTGAFAKISETIVGTALLAFKGFENATTSFQKQTGLLNEQTTQILETTTRNTIKFGAGFEDASQAMQAFVNSTLMSNEEIQKLGTSVFEQTALMSTFGVSAETTARSMDVMVRALGMSGEEALETQKRIASLGKALGVNVGQLASSFAENLPRLSLYGAQAESIFNRTAVAATKMGLGVDDVLSLGESFQTFDSAATSAGRLNAILGGGFVDNIALMEASFEDPAKAAMMVRDAIAQANQNAQSLGAMGIKAVGDILGISDMSKVRKFLEAGPSDDIFKELSAPMIDTKEEAKLTRTAVERQADLMQGQMMESLDAMGFQLQDANNILRMILDSIGGLPLALGGALAISGLGSIARGAVASAATAGGTGLIASLAGGGAALGTAAAAALPVVGTAALLAGSGYLLYNAMKSDEPKQPPRTQARQVTAAASRATQTTQRAMSSTQRMAAQTDTLIKETNSTLSDVRSLFNDIKSNTASTGKQVSSALKAG